MKKLIFLCVLFFAVILLQAQTKQQTVDSMESILKDAYLNNNFKVSSLVLKGTTLITTYSDGDVYKKDILQEGPLKIAKRAGKYSVEMEGANLIIFGSLKSEEGAQQLKNTLQHLIDLLKSTNGENNNSTASISFEDKRLSLIQSIFYETNRNNIIDFLKNKGYGEPEIDEPFDQYGEVLNFTSKFSKIEIEYKMDNSILNISDMYAGALNNVFVELELKEKGYKQKLKKLDPENPNSPDKIIWSYSGKPYIFVTFASEKEKIGVLGFGIFED